MAKPAGKDDGAGMAKGDLKRMLKAARNEPVSIAFALGGDGKAVVEMDKRKGGRILEKKLKEGAPESKNHRFGTAAIDPDDEKTVIVTVNKAGGGMARKMILAFKGTGISKVKLQLEDGSEVESHEEEDETAPGDDEGDEASPAADAPDDAAPGADASGDVGPLAEAQPSAPAGGDPAALTKELTGLVKRMLAAIAKDPTQKAALTEMATDAKASLARNDLTQARAGVDLFREAIEAVEAGPGSGSPADGAAAAGVAAAGADAAGAGADAAQALVGELTHAVKTVLPKVKSFPGLGDAVRSTAASAHAAIKSGNHGAAKAAIAQIHGFGAGIPGGEVGGMAADGESGLGEAVGGVAGDMTGETPKPPHDAHGEAHRAHAAKHAPSIDLARKVWASTRTKVQGDIDKLHKAFGDALEGHGMADELSKTMREKVQGAMQALDDQLVHTLSAINNAGNAEERDKHVQQAHRLVQHYRKHVTSDPVIQMLDRNPFTPLGIGHLVGQSLEALSKSIR